MVYYPRLHECRGLLSSYASPYGPLTALLPSSGSQVAVENRKRPSILALSRQNMPNLPGTSIEGTAKGGYTIHEGAAKPDVILMGTGSELQLAYDAAVDLEKEGIKVCVGHLWLFRRLACLFRRLMMGMVIRFL